MSNVWRGITDNVEWLKKGSAVAVGNGRSTLFWDHCWATDVPFRELITGPIPSSMEGAIVEELWDSNSGWRWDLIASIIPSSALKCIAAHRIAEDPNLGDIRYWKGSNSGSFSIKYAMSIMKEDDMTPADTKWDLAWLAPVQQRIRVFLWLLLHDRVLCNANKMLRHLTNDPRCKRCNQDMDETLLHLLRDCPIARDIWRSVGGTSFYPSFYTGNLQEWLIRNLKGGELIHSERWPTCFASALWWIWRWRNYHEFGNADNIPVDMGAFIRNQSDLTWDALSGGSSTLSTGPVNKPRHERLIRWLAPPMGWACLNTDGAAKGSPGFAGGGGILRDCRGAFIKCFTANFGICNAYKVELMAAELGLQMERNLGVSKLILQMDNKACVEAISNAAIQGGECVHILSSCCSLINSFSCSSLAHCFREGNRVADRLANMGVIHEKRVIYFDSPPIEINNLLREDVVGVAWPRFVA